MKRCSKLNVLLKMWDLSLVLSFELVIKWLKRLIGLVCKYFGMNCWQIQLLYDKYGYILFVVIVIHQDFDTISLKLSFVEFTSSYKIYRGL